MPAREPEHADHDAHHTLALNPLIGLGARDVVDAAKTVFKAAVRHPEIAVSQWLSFLGDLGKTSIHNHECTSGATAVE